MHLSGECSVTIETIHLIYFSPTGTTRRIVAAIAEGIGGARIVETDLTYPDHHCCPELGSRDIAIIGIPVYAGRVPELAVNRLKALSGAAAPAVVVAVYGNRAYEDALLELRDMAVGKDFTVVAAGAFIGEHSFSTDDLPVGPGRPDELDLEIAGKFGETIMSRLESSEGRGDHAIEVPGNAPYQEGMKNLPFTPVVDDDICTQCEICIERCPSGAVSLADRIRMDVDSCILCAACLKSCPESAISLSSTPIAERMVMLNQNCSERREPELFV